VNHHLRQVPWQSGFAGRRRTKEKATDTFETGNTRSPGDARSGPTGYRLTQVRLDAQRRAERDGNERGAAQTGRDIVSPPNRAPLKDAAEFARLRVLAHTGTSTNSWGRDNRNRE
jgi:hypothetical protein